MEGSSGRAVIGCTNGGNLEVPASTDHAVVLHEFLCKVVLQLGPLCYNTRCFHVRYSYVPYDFMPGTFFRLPQVKSVVAR